MGKIETTAERLAIIIFCSLLIYLPFNDFSADRGIHYGIKSYNNGTTTQYYPTEIHGSYSCYLSFYIYNIGAGIWCLLTIYELYGLCGLISTNSNHEDPEGEMLQEIDKYNNKTTLMMASGSFLILACLVWRQCMNCFHSEYTINHWSYYTLIFISICSISRGIYRFLSHNVVVSGDDITIKSYKSKGDLYSRVYELPGSK